MPTRILREGILTSEKVNALTFESERFYRRLMSVVDDYGRYFSHPSLIRAACYGLQLDAVSEADVKRMLSECVAAALIVIYNSGKNLLILNFKQQTRSPSKFPQPSAGEMLINCTSNDVANVKRMCSESESESESESDAKTNAESVVAKRPSGVPATQEQAVEWAGMRGVPGEQARQYFDQLEGRNWKDGAGQPVTNFQSYAASRYSRTKDEPNSKHQSNRSQTPSERRNSQIYE